MELRGRVRIRVAGRAGAGSFLKFEERQMKRFMMALVGVMMLSQMTMGAEAAKLPAGAEEAKARIEKTPRHTEYVDIAVPGQKAPMKSYVVFPEKKEKAPVVIVFHEIFGLSDWIKGVADQLAADGFIAIAPDMLSGMGKDGGGTEAIGGRDEITQKVRSLKPDQVMTMLDAV